MILLFPNGHQAPVCRILIEDFNYFANFRGKRWTKIKKYIIIIMYIYFLLYYGGYFLL